MTTLLAFIFVFGLLVFVHELGHFMAARIFGVRVDEFAFGFPPKIWQKKRGDTKYSINLIPFGGYVKLYGEEGEGNKKDSKNFLSKRAWQRIIILAAGVLMNLLLAYLILTGFYLFGGRPLIPGMENHPNVINNQSVLVTEVAGGSPAEKAGISQGAVIEKVEGVAIESSAQVFEAVQDRTKEDENAEITLEYTKDSVLQTRAITTYPETVDQNGQKISYRRIGITMKDQGGIRTVWWAAPIVAASESVRLVKLTFTGFSDVITESLKNWQLSDQLGGPIAIYVLTGTAAKLGFGTLLQVLAVLSLTLAIINIMPFPALDGGHILFIGLEKLIRRPIPEKIKQAVNLAGFCLLLLLIVLISIKDFNRFGILKAIKELFS